MCNTWGCKDAESFEADVYVIESGSKTEMSFQELFDYLNSAIDDEYFLTKKERDDYFDKFYSYDAESFEAESVWCDNCGDDLGEEGLMGDIHVVQSMPVDFDSGEAGESATLCYECYDDLVVAESFEAQTKLTAFTRGKDWEGKPYTGQIFPDHPDLDPKLADRNQDGKMASWERAIGNQVAKGKSRFKAPRKMTKTTTKFTQRKPITAASSLLPYAIAVGALATILGLRGKE
jgi:hypothetical protein